MLNLRVALVRKCSDGLRSLYGRRCYRFVSPEEDPDKVLETIRRHFLDRWSSRVHALRWLFPADLSLNPNPSDPVLVLHVDNIGSLFGRKTGCFDRSGVADCERFGDSILQREATRTCPFQPWSDPCWFDGMAGWLKTNFEHKPGQEVQQVRVNATGAVLKLIGVKGTYFLKALPSFLSYENRLLSFLHRRLPGFCPPLLAATPDGNTHITLKIRGTPLTAVDDAAKWKAALAGLARLQIASAAYADEMRLAEVPFQSFQDLSAMLRRSLEHLIDVQKSAPNRLNTAELRHIPALAAMAEADFARLERCGLPDAIIHGDLNESNIFVSNAGECKLIDWSFSRVGHPLFCLRHCLFSTFETRHRLYNEREQIRRAYLDPWLDCTSMGRLRNGLGAARRLMPIEHAHSLASYLIHIQKEEPGNVRYIATLLREALTRYQLSC